MKNMFSLPHYEQLTSNELERNDNNQEGHKEVAELENEIYLHYYIADSLLYHGLLHCYHCCCYKGRCVEVESW